MLKVGLTGGIAVGKSVVGEMFVAHGAHLVQADHIAHELMQPGEKVYDQVVQRFGREILNPDRTVNRAQLAQIAFATAPDGKSRIEELNRIVHPVVIARQDEWMEEIGRQDPGAVAIVEAALIIEAGASKHFDRLIVVTCRPDQRVARFAARQKISLEAARVEVARRMAAQLPDEEKIKAADYVIDNSGPLENTEARVREMWAILGRAANPDSQTRSPHD
jgi:dephospho-CoA kinase